MVECRLWLSLSLRVVSLVLFILVGFPLHGGYSIGSYELGVDTLSFGLLVLSIWLIVLVFSSRYKVVKDFFFFEGYYSILLFLLLLILFVRFRVLNFLGFYIFFEGSLIPTFLVIMGWGYQPERLQARIYFLFYTVVYSLPLLLGLLICYHRAGSLIITSRLGSGGGS